MKKAIDNATYDKMLLSLEESLYAACVISGIELPEMEQWRQEIQREEREAEASLRLETMVKPQKRQVNKTKVGRNEPCPCGSGKKYKKCCGK